ncbi:DUF4097 family beta strand repeat-containing protein [Clostridium sp. C2-6-12]|uniref:DUF4097 family beta strand repeat-containing protein n=1 Tax=Clostridium sp. C2-6-12 TaxID=2698832 RepID=UPI00136ED725|nr:DUF4097 family beta strand repeat-containing protein [Clostridium sp. C2-6-12]
MKRILVLGIISIITLSIIGCDANSTTQNSKSNYESNNISAEISNSSDNNDNKAAATEDISITINSNETIDEKIAMEEINDVNIEVSAAKVSIKSYDGEEIKITGKLSEKSKGMTINKKNSKFEIIEKGYNVVGSFKSDDDKSVIDVLIPSKFKGNLTFKQGAGLADIEGLKVKNIDISGGAGKLQCNEVKFDKLNLNSGVGMVDLNLNEKCGDIAINGSIGETNIRMAEVGGNLKYRGGVGNVNITIPKNSPVKFDVEKGVGSCKIDAKTSSEQTYTFDLKAGVGSINIRN